MDAQIRVETSTGVWFFKPLMTISDRMQIETVKDQFAPLSSRIKLEEVIGELKIAINVFNTKRYGTDFLLKVHRRDELWHKRDAGTITEEETAEFTTIVNDLFHPSLSPLLTIEIAKFNRLNHLAEMTVLNVKAPEKTTISGLTEEQFNELWEALEASRKTYFRGNKES